jgi:hypothetical protein
MKDYYVYCYLTENRTPYYVGMGRGNRAYRHCNSYDAPVPERNLIIILEDGLTQASAWLREEIFIAIWGRKCDGGILDNKARGGAGWGGGSPATPERKRKISKANRGRKLTAKQKAFISKLHKGVPEDPEVVKQRALSCCRSITLLSPEGDTVTFESSKACAKELSVDQSTISHLKRGKIKSVKGYKLA